MKIKLALALPCFQEDHIRQDVIQCTFAHLRPTKTQICLRIRVVWSVFFRCSFGIQEPMFQQADSKNSDQTMQVRRLIWALAWLTISSTFSHVAANLRGRDTLGSCVTIFTRDKLLWLHVFFPAHQAPSEKGFTLKRKNLIPSGANSYF